MTDPTAEQSLSSAECALTREEGGFAPYMEVFTPSGPTRVDDLTVSDSVYALNPETKLVKSKPVVALEHVTPTAPLVTIETRRAEIHASASQPIYYRTKAIDLPHTTTAGSLTDRHYYKFLTDWQAPAGRHLDTVDVTDLTDRYEARVLYAAHGNSVRATLPEGCEPLRTNSHTGFFFDATTFKRHQKTIESDAETVEICAGANAWGRPYRFDGDDFIRFLAWFVTEGSVHRPDSSDTVRIGIAQRTAPHRQTIESLFDRLGIPVAISASAFEFGSAVYGELLERLCGIRSADRHLPWFVWNLSQAQKQLLLETLLEGDGNERGTYYTASEQLAQDVLRLAIHLGISPRFSNRYGRYQIYINTTKDGFRSDLHVDRVPETGSLVRLTVSEYPAVLVGRDGKFQWVGVSRIA
jgi:hypothetical protein